MYHLFVCFLFVFNVLDCFPSLFGGLIRWFLWPRFYASPSLSNVCSPYFCKASDYGNPFVCFDLLLRFKRPVIVVCVCAGWQQGQLWTTLINDKQFICFSWMPIIGHGKKNVVIRLPFKFTIWYLFAYDQGI